MTPSAEDSAYILGRKLFEHEPFIFTKYGDAEIRWCLQFGDQVAEGATGTPELGRKLLDAWITFGRHPYTIIGDWQTASFGRDNSTRYPEEWTSMVGMLEIEPRWIHYESLLLMRLNAELRDFYKLVATDSRQKVLVAPERLAGAANMLRAEHIEVPLRIGSKPYEPFVRQLEETSWEIALFCFGRASKMIMADLCLLFPERTMIDLGTGLDPLFGFCTRSGQVSTAAAWRYFAELW